MMVGSGTVMELIESQASRTPNGLAIEDDHASLTYREFVRRAAKLAGFLDNLGVCAEEIVALAMPPSIDLFVSWLAVMKVGGVYLPLDPRLPAERMNRVLGDAQPKWVLTSRVSTEDVREKCPTASVRVREVTCAGEALTGTRGLSRGAGRAACGLLPDWAAYLIYTSGSTGAPKGVITTHSGLGQLAHTEKERFSVTPASRILQFANIGFDASIWEALMAFTTGACLVLSDDVVRSGMALAGTLRSRRITHVTLPPSILATLPYQEDLKVKTLIVAGDQCASSLVGRWASRVKMFNAYGRTESTVCTTITSPLAGYETPRLGMPILGSYLYVLDPLLNRVTAGEVGELYIAGGALARGYINRPDLTAERFVANPFGSAGSRMYRTGDLGKLAPDGGVGFVGRTDYQIKIRGFRVELGEIERVLGSQYGVMEACVLAIPNGGSGPQLIAFLGGGSPDPLDTRSAWRRP